MRNKLLFSTLITSSFLLIYLPRASAHTKCKQSLPFGGWTEGCLHSHKLSTGGFTGYKTNKFDLKDNVRAGGWEVIWANDITETDAGKGVVAAGVSIYSSNPGPFIAWVEALADRTMSSLSVNLNSARRSQVRKITHDVIKQAIQGKSWKEISKKYDTFDFKAGAIKYSGANYALGNTVSKTWGMKPYVAFRIRSSTSRSGDNSAGVPSQIKFAYYCSGVSPRAWSVKVGWTQDEACNFMYRDFEKWGVDFQFMRKGTYSLNSNNTVFASCYGGTEFSRTNNGVKAFHTAFSAAPDTSIGCLYWVDSNLSNESFNLN